MDKSYLKERWSKYIDTDKLVDDIAALLTTYNHRHTEHGICAMLATYFTNKEPLIEMIQKSDHYVGNLRIVKRKEFARENPKYEIANFCQRFASNIRAEKILLRDKDASGKTINDHIKTGITRFNIKKLHDTEFTKQLKKIDFGAMPFDNMGYTKESREKLNTFNSSMGVFQFIYDGMLGEQQVEKLAPYVKVGKGTKTSRAFNKLCTSLGITDAPNYNKEFAKYADMVSTLTRDLDYVISVNPYDYLTMSFGVNWSSCHTIDKTNVRRMPNHYSGQYCGGTLSYMLDGSSIITYVVEKDDNVQTGGKIYRNMFHFQNNALIQGRVYPQGNDGATNLYEKFREFMHSEIAAILGVENHWTLRKGSEACISTSISQGAHYRDYMHFNYCNMSYLTAQKDSIGTIYIGNKGICPYCGEEIEYESCLSHNVCQI